MPYSEQSEIKSWIKTVLFALIGAIFVTNVLIVNAQVPTGSMESTIMTKDRLIANRLAYIVHKPERFDIVVFRWPDDEKQLFVKRIIGLPGEKVSVRDGKVFINDSKEPLPDNFIKEPQRKDNYGDFIVPEGKYFMMGDNRNNSNDSRFWKEKYVSQNKILGKAVLKYFNGFKIYTKGDIAKSTQ